jgi:hypothetical protein
VILKMADRHNLDTGERLAKEIVGMTLSLEGL